MERPAMALLGSGLIAFSELVSAAAVELARELDTADAEVVAVDEVVVGTSLATDAKEVGVALEVGVVEDGVMELLTSCRLGLAMTVVLELTVDCMAREEVVSALPKTRPAAAVLLGTLRSRVAVGKVKRSAEVVGASGLTVCPPAARKDERASPASVIVVV